MDLFEYQGKQFFARYGIPVSARAARPTPSTRPSPRPTRVGYPVVVKAQVQVGGRGKAGGIKLANDADEVRDARREHPRHGHQGPRRRARLGRARLATSPRSTTPASRSTAPPRSTSAMLSAAGRRRDRGGRRAEPRRHRQDLHSTRSTGSTEAQRRRRGSRPPSSTRTATDGAVDILVKLYRCLHRGRLRPRRDQPADPHARRARCTPSTPRSASTTTPRSAIPSGTEYDATQVLDEREQLAHEKGLQYIGLDGSVGIIANGAGLAMSTLDVVNQVGGEPANFLDIGGGANADVMAGALEVINNDQNVRVDLHQHLRRHHQGRGGRQRHRRRRSAGSTSTRRSSSASTAPTPRRAARSWSTPASSEPSCSSKPTMLDAARSRRRARRSGSN